MRKKPSPQLGRFNPAQALAEEPELVPARGKAKTKRLKHQGDWEVDGVMVSDHALVRWLEVKYGLNAAEVRRQMVAQGRAAIIKQMRTCKVPVGKDGAKLIARDGLIVTVLKGDYKNVPKTNGALLTGLQEHDI